MTPADHDALLIIEGCLVYIAILLTILALRR